MHIFDESTDEIRVRAGETFALSLAANPTTGYTWRAEADDRCLALVEQRFEAGGGALGAAGRERLVFRAVQPGRCRLDLTYARPWEGAPRRRQTIAVEIE